MSYAGVESESEYAQRTYGLVPKGSCDHEAIRRQARREMAQRLRKKSIELARNDSISWKAAFKRLREEIIAEESA